MSFTSAVIPSASQGWQFEGTTTDRVTGLTGTTTGVISYVSGLYNQAVNINNPTGGTANYISYSLGSSFLPTSFTWTYWIKYGQIPVLNIQAPVYFTDSLASYTQFRVTLNGTRNSGSRPYLYNNSAYLDVPVINQNTWYHFAVVLSSGSGGSTITLYFNSTLIGSFIGNNNQAATLNNMYVGSANTIYGSVCVVDDLRLFNTSLTATQLQNIYNQNANPLTGSTLLYKSPGYATSSAMWKRTLPNINNPWNQQLFTGFGTSSLTIPNGAGTGITWTVTPNPLPTNITYTSSDANIIFTASKYSVLYPIDFSVTATNASGSSSTGTFRLSSSNIWDNSANGNNANQIVALNGYLYTYTSLGGIYYLNTNRPGYSRLTLAGQVIWGCTVSDGSRYIYLVVGTNLYRYDTLTAAAWLGPPLIRALTTATIAYAAIAPRQLAYYNSNIFCVPWGNATYIGNLFSISTTSGIITRYNTTYPSPPTLGSGGQGIVVDSTTGIVYMTPNDSASALLYSLTPVAGNYNQQAALVKNLGVPAWGLTLNETTKLLYFTATNTNVKYMNISIPANAVVNFYTFSGTDQYIGTVYDNTTSTLFVNNYSFSRIYALST